MQPAWVDHGWFVCPLQKAALEDHDAIAAALQGSDMVFVTVSHDPIGISTMVKRPCPRS